MAIPSLYRRYRPRRFAELKGQDHVVRGLRDAVRSGREGQAYLFSGPRGTGKTSSARILAKVLNCQNPIDGEPCCECESCLAVEQGTSYDVHELDAASNNGVDAMRDLIERASLGTPGRHKVYILDEVHMLSRAAEAALLKTLEEPPDHVVFVLATTDPQKVSETIRSRTQHLRFHLLPADTLADHVRWIVDDAGLQVSEHAIGVALTQGGGSARDTLSALELIIASGDDDDPGAVSLDEFV
ncbi:MAG: DNA polymerase III subunit gamma/tau, partial [Acidimicrobiia bacterium]|nr:DNA polymerase III subunit gamma/tau [Acidimicrobiia bacterium]